MSSNKAEAVFSAGENAFEAKIKRQALNSSPQPPGLSWVLDGEKFSDVFSPIRYADDCILSSRLVCCECLSQAGTEVYPSPIVYEKEEDSKSGTVSFVDLLLYRREDGTLDIKQNNRNVAFVIGESLEQERTRFAPYLGAKACSEPKVSAWVSAQWHGERRTEAASWKLFNSVAVAAELALLRYPGYKIMSALGAIQHPSLRKTRDAVRAWVKRRWHTSVTPLSEPIDAWSVRQEMRLWKQQLDLLDALEAAECERVKLWGGAQ